MENVNTLYQAQSLEQVFTISQLKQIINQIPEEMLGFEVVCADKNNDNFVGIQITNLVLDSDASKLVFFDLNFIERLRIEAQEKQLKNDQENINETNQ